MPSNEDADSLYKRLEDREWRKKVDHEQVTLMTAHQVMDARMDKAEDRMDDLEDALHGDPVQGTSGIIGRLETEEHERSRLTAVVFQDASGEKGLLHRVEELERNSTFWGFVWTFLTNAVTQAVILLVAIISLLGLLITNWDRVAPHLPGYRPPKAHSSKAQKKKAPKPAPEEDDE